MPVSTEFAAFAVPDVLKFNLFFICPAFDTLEKIRHNPLKFIFGKFTKRSGEPCEPVALREVAKDKPLCVLFSSDTVCFGLLFVCSRLIDLSSKIFFISSAK